MLRALVAPYGLNFFVTVICEIPVSSIIIYRVNAFQHVIGVRSATREHTRITEENSAQNDRLEDDQIPHCVSFRLCITPYSPVRPRLLSIAGSSASSLIGGVGTGDISTRSPYVALVRRRGTAVELPAKAYRGKTKHKKTLRAKAATRNLVSWRGKDRGVIAYAGYILGFAGDTPERIDQDIRIILAGIAHVAPDHDVHIALVAAGMQSERRRGLGNGPERPGQRAADRKPTGQCQFRSVPGRGLPS